MSRRATFFTLLLLLSMSPATLLSQNSSEQAIRAIREASNAAIAGRNLQALGQTWVEDLHVTTSSGDLRQSGEDMEAAFASRFRDPEFVTYVRTPIKVSISQGRSFAAEQGEWVGTWNKPDGQMNIRGVYLAQWQEREGGWRIRSEVFVALSCEGSATCEDQR